MEENTDIKSDTTCNTLLVDPQFTFCKETKTKTKKLNTQQLAHYRKL